jgi:hypothetical protein
MTVRMWVATEERIAVKLMALLLPPHPYCAGLSIEFYDNTFLAP